MRGKHIFWIYSVVRNKADAREIMTRNLTLLILRIIYKAKKCQVIAIVLINNKLTYANEANGDPQDWDRGGILI